MSVPRFGLATAAVGTVLYAIGGMSKYGSPFSLVEAYETKAGALGAWVPRTVLPNMLARFNGAAVIDGKIYVPGGRDAMGIAAASLFVYTPGTNSWSSKKPMPKPGFGGGEVAIDGKLYVVTNPGDGTRSVLFRYTPATDQWAVLAQPYKNLKGAVLGVINGKLYAAGGYKSLGQFSDALLVYDPAKNTWTSKASMPVPRYYGAGRVVGGKLYVAGGASQVGSVTGRTDAYDPSTNTVDAEEGHAHAADGGGGGGRERPAVRHRWAELQRAPPDDVDVHSVGLSLRAECCRSRGEARTAGHHRATDHGAFTMIKANGQAPHLARADDSGSSERRRDPSGLRQSVSEVADSPLMHSARVSRTS